jgi:hypothetical protein
MGGTGMEQARKAVRGATRRGGENPRGRNLTGRIGSAGDMWLLAAQIRRRGRNLGRGVQARFLWGSRLFAVMHG